IKRWEYFDDPSLVGKDSTLVGNRFSDGFELDDGTTFLCGTRFREGHQLGTTVQISAARAVTSQNLKSLGAHDTAITKCLRWNQGIVLLAGVAGDKNTGWLVMLDSPGKLRYVRFGEEFRAVDAYEAENHDLIILSSDNRVSRVDNAGRVVAHYDIANGSSTILLHPLMPTDAVRVALMLDTFKTVFLDLDQNLTQVAEVSASNVGLKMGFQLADRSSIIFGSTFSGYATANVARLYASKLTTNYTLQPLHAAGWVEAATTTPSPNEYAMLVNLMDGDTIIFWATFTPNAGSHPGKQSVGITPKPESHESNAGPGVTDSEDSVNDDSPFPTPPNKHLKSITNLPPHDQIVLEARSMPRLEIGVFDLTTHTESKWNVLGTAAREVAVGSGSQWADWAPRARKLFFATQQSAHLASPDGTTEELHLQMPGKLPHLWGMSSYTLSSDATRVAYQLNARDVWAPHTDRLGTLYDALMYQQTHGSPPIDLAHGDPVPTPAWRPDGAARARVNSDDDVVVSDLSGRTLWSVHPGPPHKEGSVADWVDRIKWNPTGQQLAFLAGAPGLRLFVVNADGTDLHQVRFKSSLGCR
ncbi:MAG TPA: hypothetical protein VMT66_05875, partial [Steroidobacteraceae bacterium]|nr:hypothetical protein [Steroidobacteraceae bacterium]